MIFAKKSFDLLCPYFEEEFVNLKNKIAKIS